MVAMFASHSQPMRGPRTHRLRFTSKQWGRLVCLIHHSIARLAGFVEVPLQGEHFRSQCFELGLVQQPCHFREKVLLFFFVMVLGLLLEYFELGFECLICGAKLEQIGEQTLERQMLFERLQQYVLRAPRFYGRVEHLFFGRDVHRELIGNCREEGPHGRTVGSAQHLFHRRFHFPVLTYEQIYSIHEEAFFALRQRPSFYVIESRLLPAVCQGEWPAHTPATCNSDTVKCVQIVQPVQSLYPTKNSFPSFTADAPKILRIRVGVRI
jgi:hypothetical protein